MSLFAAATVALALAGQDPRPPATPDPEAATRLADVIVSGRRNLNEEAEAFVGEVAGPAPRRGLARWPGRVCVAAVNVSPQVARAVVDEVSRLALELNLRIGAPGCTPNIVIVFTEDAPAMASAMVAADRRAFHMGVGGLDRGNRALAQFQTSDAPVRWWHVSMPVVGATGAPAVRMPGDAGPIMVPGEGIVNRGRPISDNLNKAIIVVDVSRTGQVTLPQLTDYLGLVAMAQIDPEGQTAAYDTVLNLFDDPQGVAGLSDWDAIYLEALYSGARERVRPDDHASAIARRVRRAARTEAERPAAAE
ncbi:hypothetical protein [Brevundimonas sp. FT23042]|uniref:hypothetical protein n=1 Tax=Brevundimonas sp. FT23042 TaxID=3393749 RepID=UPI003B58AA9B